MKSLEERIEEEMSAALERVTRLAWSHAVGVVENSRPGRVPGGSRPPERGRQHGASTPADKNPARRSPAARRSADEIETLSNRFLQAVRDEPGQPMAVLAPRIGAKPRELQVPVARLKAARRVKTVGQRHLTVYFPVDEAA